MSCFLTLKFVWKWFFCNSKWSAFCETKNGQPKNIWRNKKFNQKHWIYLFWFSVFTRHTSLISTDRPPPPPLGCRQRRRWHRRCRCWNACFNKKKVFCCFSLFSIAKFFNLLCVINEAPLYAWVIKIKNKFKFMLKF